MCLRTDSGGRDLPSLCTSSGGCIIIVNTLCDSLMGLRDALIAGEQVGVSVDGMNVL